MTKLEFSLTLAPYHTITFIILHFFMKKLTHFKKGILQELPLQIGVFPFGIIYGLFFSYFIFSITLFFVDKISENLSFFLLENSKILLNIYLFNETHIFKHIPFLLGGAEKVID